VLFSRNLSSSGLKNRVRGWGLESSRSGEGPGAGSYEHGDAQSGSITAGNF
jgi:hypothetical protein